MKNQIAEDILRQALNIRVARGMGVNAGMFRMSGSRMEEQTIADITRLPAFPVDPNTPPMQDPTGKFYFLVGYSQTDGSDIIAP